MYNRLDYRNNNFARASCAFLPDARAKVSTQKKNPTLQYENVDPATSPLGSDTSALPKWIPSTICSFLTVSVLTSYTPMYSAKAAADVAMTSDSFKSHG